jgi:hypothetical protein
MEFTRLVLPVVGTLLGAATGSVLTYLAQSHIAEKTYRRAISDRRLQRIRESYEGLGVAAIQTMTVGTAPINTLEDCIRSALRLIEINDSIPRDTLRALTDDIQALDNHAEFINLQRSASAYISLCQETLTDSTVVGARDAQKKEVVANFAKYVGSVTKHLQKIESV